MRLNKSILPVLTFLFALNFINQAKAEYQANLNLLCRPVAKKIIRHDTDSDYFQVFDITDVKEKGDTHRFKGDSLYLTGPSGDYLYNTVTSLDDIVNGYRSGNKTIQFNSNGSHAVVTQISPGSTEVYTLKCSGAI